MELNERILLYTAKVMLPHPLLRLYEPHTLCTPSKGHEWQYGLKDTDMSTTSLGTYHRLRCGKQQVVGNRRNSMNAYCHTHCSAPYKPHVLSTMPMQEWQHSLKDTDMSTNNLGTYHTAG